MGKSIVALTNLFCRPTILYGVNFQVSSDYRGAMYQQLDQQRGGANIFLHGSVGDGVQPAYEPKTAESVKREVGEVAAVVLNAMKQLQNDISFGHQIQKHWLQLASVQTGV
jgi:hypothetical protein